MKLSKTAPTTTKIMTINLRLHSDNSSITSLGFTGLFMATYYSPCLSTGDPVVFQLAVRCNWTFRIPGNGSSPVVALGADSTDDLAEQICQDLGCGGVYMVEEGSSLPNATCFHNCFYHNGRLQNCSRSAGKKCTVMTKVVCGEVISVTCSSDRIICQKLMHWLQTNL